MHVHSDKTDKNLFFMPFIMITRAVHAVYYKVHKSNPILPQTTLCHQDTTLVHLRTIHFQQKITESNPFQQIQRFSRPKALILIKILPKSSLLM